LINKGFLNTNTAITRQLKRTVRTLEAELRQVQRGSVNTGANEGESRTGRVWAASFYHVTACSRFARVLKLMNCLFVCIVYIYVSFKVLVCMLLVGLRVW
jgi:hypothetical protein